MKQAIKCAEELCAFQADNDFWDNGEVVIRQEKYIPIIAKYMKEALLQHSGEKRFNRKLVKWAKVHHWGSLESQKDLILRHLRTFAGDEAIYGERE